MSLATFQQAIQNLYMSESGKQAVQSVEALDAFLADLPLTEAEKQLIRSQSLDRLQQYEYMVGSNVEETLRNIFPFTHTLLEADWEALVSRYLCRHPNPSYHLMVVGQDFPQYLASQTDWMVKYPFLFELAWVEWVEAKLLSATSPVLPDSFYPTIPNSPEALSLLSPLLNPVAEGVQLHYPIPPIIAFLKETPEQTLPPHVLEVSPSALWIYRHPQSLTCRFFEINSLLAAWLTRLQSNTENETYQGSLQPLWKELEQQTPGLSQERFYQEFLSALQPLFDAGILMGSWQFQKQP